MEFIYMPLNVASIPKFSIVTEAKKQAECGCGDLERDIGFYRGAVERNDPRKYNEFLTDRDRLIGEELMRRGILESRLSTTWLEILGTSSYSIYKSLT
jgi:hypothetical protein